MITSSHPILVTCATGAAPFQALEIKRLGLPIVGTFEYGVETSGTWDDALKLNLWSRTAQAVLFEVAQFKARTPDQLYAEVTRLPWESVLFPDGYLTITSTVYEPSLRDPRFATLRCKDAIVDRMVKACGSRPNSGPDRTGVVVHLHWENGLVSIYLNTSGETLSRRGYRKHTGVAPMQEALAAACIAATEWTGATAFVNPMCGSGTLAIEAALIAANRAPGLTRKHHAFQKVRGFKEATWKALCREAESAIKPITVPIVATDNDPGVIDAARANAAAAGVDAAIQFAVCDYKETAMPPGPGVVILNPEYGERIGKDKNLEPVYRAIGDFFKQRCGGYMGYIFTGNLQMARSIGLRSKRRLTFFNGSIECRLLEFELYAGTRDP